MGTHIDHIVIAAPNLEDLVSRFEKLTGVKAVAGGRHDTGTANALVPLAGTKSYLELIGPDPEATAVTRDNFAIATTTSTEPRVAAWCVRPDDLEALAKQRGTQSHPMSRHTPEGTTLSWRLILPEPGVDFAPVPFAIDWLDSPHPSKVTELQVSIHSFTVYGPTKPDELPEPAKFQQGEPYLELVLESPKGRVNLSDL
ncbi:hypothetical protein N24_0315 [Corynebacterium suranareeae]|uniref:Glyoxalase-like domain-containing protein n=1 Tax=Corynebacterium suranareeae TaxID=2506452 RepID=A0A160PLI0_9CORY|nr:VOC family protein [Corynebacterium suranareeae]BAU94577.1 hypothetical protein N24_0315 [Corynebacterium suranareeae]